MQTDNTATPTTESVIDNVPTPTKRSFNTLQIVWAIINLILCCMPLGIAALVCTVLAKYADTDESEKKNLKAARVCNIIATIIGVVSLIIAIVSTWIKINMLSEIWTNIWNLITQSM